MADTAMDEAPKSPPPFKPDPNEPLYGGYTRFELELEVLPFPLIVVHMTHIIPSS